MFSLSGVLTQHKSFDFYKYSDLSHTTTELNLNPLKDHCHRKPSIINGCQLERSG